MILFKNARDLSLHLSTLKKEGHITGFVPTMGALHEGHLRLVAHSKKNTDTTLASIFVNPTQFNDPADFAQYPVTLEQDIYLLEKNGCDILFLPSVNEIYPNGIATTGTYSLGRLETLLEGKHRPGHFQGVCQVVDRLLEIVAPNTLFLGQKDYQQCMVIRELLKLTGRQTALCIVPTMREPSGLAMSSRNLRLSDAQKHAAVSLFESLSIIKQKLVPGATGPLIEAALAQLAQAGFEQIDYISIADAATLEPVDHWNGQTEIVALAAAFIGGVRLIDNLPLN